MNTKPTATSVEVHFEDSEDLVINFATNVFVRFEPHLFHIAFAQAIMPVDLNPDLDELQRSGVRARVVTKLAIPPDHWKRMVEAFAHSYANWEAATAAGFGATDQEAVDDAADDEESAPGAALS